MGLADDRGEVVLAERGELDAAQDHDVVAARRMPERAGEVGAGVQISANGARVLQALGLRQELAAIGVQPEFREVRVWNSGLRQTQLALGNASFLRYGAPHYAVHRADLHAMLAEAVRRLKPAAIRLQARCTGFTQGPDGVRVTLANGETVAGSALIGADGIHSAIRAALFGADTARPSGCMAWRGLIRTSLLPEHVRRSINTNWIGEAAHIVTYPVREGTLLNMVGVIERHERQIESWSQRGTVEECLADFRGWHEDVQMLLGGIIEPFKWALMLRDPDRQTVTIQVVNLVAGRYSVEWNQVMAATLVATVPVGIMFTWLQRYLVRGLTFGAIQ